jgi:hypothetical protein
MESSCFVVYKKYHNIALNSLISSIKKKLSQVLFNSLSRAAADRASASFCACLRVRKM